MKQQEERFPSGRADMTLFECYAASIFAYARLHTPSIEDAEDLVLDVFTAAWEQGNLSWLAEKQQLVWLRRVAHNKLVDRYRRSARVNILSLEHVGETERYEQTLTPLTPEQIVLRREELAELGTLVGILSLFQQQVLQLRVGDGLRFAEIAVLLDKREATVRKVFSRTLAQLRSSYSQQKERSRE
jgi:RNA polymerase sigma factor (sigma-70 family)